MRAVRRVLALAVAWSVTACAGVAQRSGTDTSAGVGERLYIVNQAGASITVVDQARLAIDTVLDLRTLGFSANAKPHHVAVEDDGA